MRSSRSVKIQSENLINNDWPKYEGLELFLQLGLLLVVILPTNTKTNVWRPVRRIEVLTALTYLAFSTWFGEYLNVPEIICSG